ncbi:hypothetical protein [Nocardia sp. NPDC005366]|uniref:hypothetical protein n=1 Tax=Nocardia sp. NPDC005366 TaxID=3156878 RepID=UPI0033B9202E
MTESEHSASADAPGSAQGDSELADSENPQPSVNGANGAGPAERSSVPAPPDSPPPEDARDSAADRPPEHDSDRSSGKRTVYFNQYFNGTVQASGSRFGISEASRTPGPLTGKLNDSDIEDLAVGYIRPEAFAVAFDVLRRVHAIVLEGPSGTGRRAGATMLLRELTTGPVISLPPTMSVKQLATYDYEAGRGYLVTDSEYAASRIDSEHEWHAVRDQVCDIGAWLVVTGPVTSGRDAEFVPRVAWHRPEVRAVLRSWLSLSDVTDEDLEAKIIEIESHVPAEFAFSDLRQIVTLIASGAATAAAIQVFEEGARQRVAEWFDASGQRSRRNLLAVTVAAFLSPCGQRTFESCLIDLEQRFESAEDAAANGEIPAPPERVDSVPELRIAMVDDNSLLHLISVESDITPKSYVALRENLYREHVIDELWRRMDVAFWNAVRDWLCEILSRSSEDDGALHERTIAQGLLVLANISFDEVADAYLEPWSRGEHGLACRDMAIFLLWDMCAGKVLAPAALQIAVRWAESGSALQKWTAAFALSGVLGVSFPEEATRQLWRLIIRSSATDAVERCAVLAELFARLATWSPQADTVLSFLEGKHSDARLGPTGRLLVEAAIAEILAIQDGATGLSAVFSYLDTSPDHQELLARLWAIALRGCNFRRNALDALIDGLRDLTEITSEPERTARALAAALGRMMPSREYRLLAHNLSARHRQRVAMTAKRRFVRRITVSAKTTQRDALVDQLVRILLAHLVSDPMERKQRDAISDSRAAVPRRGSSTAISPKSSRTEGASESTRTRGVGISGER